MGNLVFLLLITNKFLDQRWYRLRIIAVIGVIFFMTIKGYGEIEKIPLSENTEKESNLLYYEENESAKTSSIEKRDFSLKVRDTNHQVREVILQERDIFNTYYKKPQDIDFMWPLKKIAVTSNWGGRVDPITGTEGSKHNGIDLAASIGTRVYSPESGIVRTARWIRGYGKTVIIDHGDGYSTRFAHLSSYNVKENDFVDRGSFIARTGNTGRSTGPHLHYEIRYEEEPLNPAEILGLKTTD